MQRARRLALALMLAASTGSQARRAAEPPSEVAAELPGARLQGTATLRFLGARVYDIQLWSHRPVTGDGSGQSLALELRYAMALPGQRIAERSIDEMRRIGPVDDGQAARWQATLAALLPDVAAGDRLTGVQRPGQMARYFHNGRPLGEVADPDFTRLFFGIWLSPRTSEPRLRHQLLAAGA